MVNYRIVSLEECIEEEKGEDEAKENVKERSGRV
jgi:hypothetical protein